MYYIPCSKEWTTYYQKMIMKTRLVNHFSLHHSDYKNMEEEESENESRY